MPPMHDVFEVLDPAPRHGHGGARKGAGRKSADYVKPVEEADYEKARARLEKAKADTAELDYRIKSNEYVARAAVRQAAATALASMTQTLRSVPDNLERRLGITPEIAESVSKSIDDALNDLADEFELMSGPDE